MPTKINTWSHGGTFYGPHKWDERRHQGAREYDIEVKHMAGSRKITNGKCSGSVDRVLDLGSKGCYFESCRWGSHYVMYFSKTPCPLLSSGSTQEDPLQHD